ncbi:MAG: BREX system P-loop protein BrxC [Methanomassiliicoccaceae archaeon]|nr:BREX system P-loop protein BrxC [Methanomassiliicoccaceae archaeon]
MSKIGEMFEKDISRPMNPVIKVSDQNDENVIFQELDEYVVTQEIDENLEKFYKGIADGMKTNTDAVGVWISGDFGSGKSHFLKILSFLLKNSKIRDKEAITYLQNKVSEAVYSYMQTIGRKNVETVLFDIDAESKEGQNADNLVQIYLMVFNRMLGLSTVASVAEMERHIIREGKYDLFKSKYQEISGKTWEFDRTKPAFVKPKIKAALVAAGLYNESDATDVADTATKKLEVSVRDFAKLVKEHCAEQGKDYTLFFLVDEVGQFISGNTQLMLKLQTITEELGVACHRQAWNIVTSQEDIDQVVAGVNNKDFSKIQGRFGVRVKMSSSDVKEVIEKRILLKKSNYVDELKAYYDVNRDAIHNKLNFDNGVNIRLYKNKEEYSNTYPFVPYQYQMLQTMLTQLRNKSRAGKNISNAARSMLKTFRDTVVEYKDNDSLSVIPMYAFYDSLTPELDSPTLQAFYDASKNDMLDVDFDLNVLKTLFLVKYYDGLTISVTNITSMMVSSFDENRITLKKKVEEALDRLVTQNLVQRNGDTYVFLTNVEQEINLEIKRESVDVGKRIQEISRIAFGEILGLSGKYKYDSDHPYPFNRIVDGENVDGTSYELGLAISTPASRVDPATLTMESINSVVLELPGDDRVIIQCNEYISTESYLCKNMSSDLPKGKRAILEAKESELKDMKDRFRELLSDALQSAKIYINGSPVQINESKPGARVEKAMSQLIEATYSKMDYMRNPKSKTIVEQIFRNRSIIPFDKACGSERNAIDSVVDYISEQAKINATVRISNVMEKFRKRPYGFNDVDIQWILAILFRHNKIGLVFEGVSYDGKKVDADKGIDLITRAKNYDRVEIKLRESVSSASINKAADIFKEILAKSLQLDESALVGAINSGSKELMHEIDGYLDKIRSNPKYPGKEQLDAMRLMLNSTASMGSPDIFQYIDHNEDAFRNLRDNLDSLRGFFAEDSPRRRLFDRGLSCLAAYTKDENYVVGEIVQTRSDIESAMNSEGLKDLHKLNGLCDSFESELNALIDAAKHGEKEKMAAFKEMYSSKFADHQDLAAELDNLFEDSMSKMDPVRSISELCEIPNGFNIKAKNVVAKIPKKQIPQDPRQQPDKAVPKKGSVYASVIFSGTEVNSEEDIEKILNSAREKMKEKLKNGPFNINW